MTDPKAAEREAAARGLIMTILAWGAVTPQLRPLEVLIAEVVAWAATRERDAAVGALRDAEKLITAEHLEDPTKGSEYDLAYDHAVGDCFEAVRARRLALEQGTPATRGETP